MWITKKVNERTDIVRQNENLYLRKENVSYDLCINSLKKICTWSRAFLVKKLESSRSYGRTYARGLI